MLEHVQVHHLPPVEKDLRRTTVDGEELNPRISTQQTKIWGFDWNKKSERLRFGGLIETKMETV